MNVFWREVNKKKGRKTIASKIDGNIKTSKILDIFTNRFLLDVNFPNDGCT